MPTGALEQRCQECPAGDPPVPQATRGQCRPHAGQSPRPLGASVHQSPPRPVGPHGTQLFFIPKVTGSGEAVSQPRGGPGEGSQLLLFPKAPHTGQTHWKGRFRPQARVRAAQGGRGCGLRRRVGEACGLPLLLLRLSPQPLHDPSPQGLGQSQGARLPPHSHLLWFRLHSTSKRHWPGWGSLVTGVLGASWFGETCG